MNFISTRRRAPPLSIRAAIEQGLAPDGGLYVPREFPTLSAPDFAGANTLPEVAAILLRPFFAEDPVLTAALPEICKKTFHFPTPLTPVKRDFILELFHGPTGAFIDVGARFLSECIQIMSTKRETVLVATSGDTGGAVAAAFFDKPNIDVVILYPKGKISPRQEAQLCAWGGNVRAIAIQGTFDDCQRLAKEAFLSPCKRSYVSANSINLGRILPQMVYYAWAALQHPGIGFIIPSGNLGNGLACMWAKKIGLPIGPIALAFNTNRSVVHYFETGNYKPLPTLPTLANAMDVSNPSNLDRVRDLYPSIIELRHEVSADWASDEEIRDAIKTSERDWGQIFCPHTAVGAVVRNKMKTQAKLDSRPWVLVATAHAAKFETIVEPLIGRPLEIPPSISAMLNRPMQNQTIQPVLSELTAILDRSSP